MRLPTLQVIALLVASCALAVPITSENRLEVWKELGPRVNPAGTRSGPSTDAITSFHSTKSSQSEDLIDSMVKDHSDAIDDHISTVLDQFSDLDSIPGSQKYRKSRKRPHHSKPTLDTNTPSKIVGQNIVRRKTHLPLGDFKWLLEVAPFKVDLNGDLEAALRQFGAKKSNDQSSKVLDERRPFKPQGQSLDTRARRHYKIPGR